MAEQLEKIYNPKTAFGNPSLIGAINKKFKEDAEKRAIAKCKHCDDYGYREKECEECNGRGHYDVTCQHTEDE